jgi:transposase/transposase InsO family protein
MLVLQTLKDEGASMNETERYEERKTAIHMRRSGIPAGEVAERLDRSIPWVYKWWNRFKAEGWAGLHSRSRAPKRCPNRLPEAVRQSVCQARSELESEATEKAKLCYIGSGAVRARLEEKGVHPLPSTASIERILHDAEMTHPRQGEEQKRVTFPHLHSTEPGQLCQVDIVPHYLRGGNSVACFNAIDVISRYPTGQARQRRRSQDAQAFLIHVWQKIGLPQYTQVDNEACFSGGFTHPGVLGKVVRLALYVGTELVFSPVRHPESNGTVERFHQDYNRHVWKDTNLQDCADVQAQGERFFAAYRRSRHHRALKGRSPLQTHAESAWHKLPSDFTLPKGRLPLTEGHVHFMRLVDAEKTISVLNLPWAVPKAQPGQGVWTTLELRADGATLRVYDQAPDALERRCLAEHPFPLKEEVQPLKVESRSPPTDNLWVELFAKAILGFARARMLLSTMF